MTCTHTATLGVYLLGALEPEDRSVFEAHLSGCDTCRAELVRLAPLPGLLNQITLADFDDAAESTSPTAGSVVAPAEFTVPVLEAFPPIARELPAAEPEPEPGPSAGKRYWPIAAAAALVLVLTIAGVLTYEVLKGPDTAAVSDGVGVTWSATNSMTGARADARLIQRPWGTEIQVKMDHVASGQSCRLVVWARGDDGYKETAGWWEAGMDGGHEIPASTSIELARIYKLELMADNEKLLVSIHRPSS
ncbi:MAG: anti-sigma factor family protein [Labedaea sp.]